MSTGENETVASDYFADRYDVIVYHPFVAANWIFLSDHGGDENARKCRFCGRKRPHVTFSRIAHAVPEFLGNKSIRSMNECDGCNAFLGSNCEDHLAKYSLFLRSISKVKGKGGKPKFKNPDNSLKVQTREASLHIELTDPALVGVLMKEGGPYKFTLPADATSQPYIPIRAAMALVKIACSICPAGELDQCTRAINWVMGRLGIQFSMLPVLYAFTPGPLADTASRVILLRRKADTPDPYLWCVVQVSGHRFQILVPGCPADDKLFGELPVTIPIHHYRLAEYGPGWPYGETEFRLFNWAGTEAVQTSASATFHVTHAARIAESDAESS